MNNHSTYIYLSVVIVNWNTRDFLLNCLATVYQQSDVNIEIIVIDNGSVDGSIEAVEEKYKDVICLNAQENLGFAKANNRAFQFCHGKYVLLLNPDTIIPAGTLSAMVAYLEMNDDVGGLGCELLYEDGSIQSNPRSFPTIFEIAMQLLFSRAPKDYPDHTKSCDVDWLSGACLMVRRKVIDEIGGLKETYFMYMEDVEWCYRIKQQGWRLVYKSDIHIFHLLGKSNQEGSKFYTVNNYRNTLDFFSSKEQGMLGTVRIFVLRLAYIVGGMTHLIGYWILHLIWTHNPYYRDRIEAYTSIIRLGLMKDYMN